MSDLIVKQQNDLIAIAKNIKGVSELTRQNYIYSVQSYQKYLKKNKLDPSTKTLEQWINTSGTPKTAISRLQAVRKIITIQYKNTPYYEAVKEELSNIRPPKIDNGLKSYNYITLKEVQKVINYAPLKIGVIIETLFTTGLRIHELVKMKYSEGHLVGKNYEFTFVGKGRKQGSVYIKKSLVDKIKKTFNSETYLFEHNGKKYRREYLTRVIGDISEKAIGKRMSAHKYRHSFAMHLYNKGLDLRKIQHALRHSNIETTSSIYLHDGPTAEELEIDV